MDEFEPLPLNTCTPRIPKMTKNMSMTMDTLTMAYRRKLILKANVQSSISCFSFKRLFPGGFNLVLIGSTCTALPWRRC